MTLHTMSQCSLIRSLLTMRRQIGTCLLASDVSWLTQLRLRGPSISMLIHGKVDGGVTVLYGNTRAMRGLIALNMWNHGLVLHMLAIRECET